MLQNVLANSMEPDETALIRRVIWIHAGHKVIRLLSPMVGFPTAGLTGFLHEMERGREILAFSIS